jgi:hypothetical protein
MKCAVALQVALFAALVGCSAAPKVKHAEIKGSFTDAKSLTDDNIKLLSGTTYQVPGSLLLIRENLDEEGEPEDRYSVESLPFEADAKIYAIYPKQGWFKSSRTILGATYVPNTRFLKSLGVQFIDDSKQLVEAVGGIAESVLGLGAEPPVGTDNTGKPLFPIVRDTAADLKSSDTSACSMRFKCKIAAGGEKDCGTVTYGALPNDAVTREVYFTTFADRITSTFPVPACRTASVRLNPWPDADGEGEGVHVNTVVIDARYVRIVELPASGQIDFHSKCGADVVAADMATDSGWTTISELAAQVESVRDARAEKEPFETAPACPVR